MSSTCLPVCSLPIPSPSPSHLLQCVLCHYYSPAVTYTIGTFVANPCRTFDSVCVTQVAQAHHVCVCQHWACMQAVCLLLPCACETLPSYSACLPLTLLFYFLLRLGTYYPTTPFWHFTFHLCCSTSVDSSLHWWCSIVAFSNLYTFLYSSGTFCCCIFRLGGVCDTTLPVLRQPFWAVCHTCGSFLHGFETDEFSQTYSVPSACPTVAHTCYSFLQFLPFTHFGTFSVCGLRILLNMFYY